MKLDETPVFRKIIIPWYDTEPFCLILIIFMDLVFLFGALGVSVSYEFHDLYQYVWIPVFLMSTSGGVIISVTIRLSRRLFYHMKYWERTE